ncbi:GNAT family N-acetyltransferase [Histoplasma capsulatum]|uniref:GNAT family N-acetyltransferase n=1 Tax=Ajellomyces capsulatus TaxID=5037 RepID=A0A8A1M328_AJECA|nr:GNAT family N-acetyltransferase [Histoplasma capsulatum]
MSTNADSSTPASMGKPPLRPIHPDYHLRDGCPSVPDYVRLRSTPNLTPKTAEQATLAIAGSWFGCYVVHTATNTPVGMGRIIGDGGWCFHIVDIAVATEHQRKGLGDAIMARLIERIREFAAPGASVSLLADPPGRKLYARHGFEDTAPYSVGMAVLL